MPQSADEDDVRAAQAELEAEDFNFALFHPGQSWDDYLVKVEKDRTGTDLGPGRVPATMLLAVVDDEIVGRVHIRHELTPSLLEVGGHIGYGVRPAHRRRGYATEMLRQGLNALGNLGITRVLVTCDDDNQPSIRTIERCGGVLENVVTPAGLAAVRRYWIEL